MLKIDYTTLNFEGVKEFVFSQQTDTFTIAGQNVNSADDNCIHLVYKELNQLLFFGTMWWEGMGELIFPDSFELPDEYETVSSDDVIFPLNGFNCPYQNSETDLGVPARRLAVGIRPVLLAVPPSVASARQELLRRSAGLVHH